MYLKRALIILGVGPMTPQKMQEEERKIAGMVKELLI